MKHLTWALSIVLALALAACGEKAGEHAHGGDHDHHASGPHGGEILDIGDHEAHLEMIVDHGAEKLVVHILSAENEALRIADAPSVTLAFEDGPKTLTAVAVGGTADGASEWHFRDKSLAGEFESGRFQLTWKGKPYEIAFEHDHDHGHAHEDDAHGHDEDHEHDEDHKHEKDG